MGSVRAVKESGYKWRLGTVEVDFFDLKMRK
jgi:hypothetical protein